MKNSKMIDNYPDIFEDMMNLFDNKYYDLLEKTDKIDKLYWEIEKEGIETKLAASLTELINIISNELKKIYMAEEFLYNEMKKIMPEHSSVTALKSENETILKLLDLIKTEMLGENLKKQKDILQAEMVAIADLIQRNIHKKINIFFHEARTMLPEEKREEIAQKIESSNLI